MSITVIRLKQHAHVNENKKIGVYEKIVDSTYFNMFSVFYTNRCSMFCHQVVVSVLLDKHMNIPGD